MDQDTYPFPGLPVWKNPERMSGELCFDRTRVPVKTLFEHLAGGISLEVFLDAFEGVTREQAVAVLAYSERWMLQEAA